MARCSAPRPRRPAKSTSAMTKSATNTALAINPASRPLRIKKVFANTPNNGSTISRTIKVSSILSPHRADVVDVGRALRTENTDEECEPDRDLGRGDGDDEEGHNLPVDIGPLPCKGDQREVGRVQHELDRHEDDHHISPCQHSDGADSEQNGAQEHVVSRRDHCLSPHFSARRFNLQTSANTLAPVNPYRLPPPAALTGAALDRQHDGSQQR